MNASIYASLTADFHSDLSFVGSEPEVQVELVFPGDYGNVIGTNKNIFLQECTAAVSKNGAVDVSCLDVRSGSALRRILSIATVGTIPTGSIIVSLGGSSDVVSAAAQEVVANGLDLPSFEAITGADLNECAGDNNNDCHTQATCTNTAGSYTCECKPGFAGDGKKCETCKGKSVYSDEAGLAQCKKCPGGHFGVVAPGSNAEGGHTACDGNTCERPTKLPANSVVLDSKCPDHGKQKNTTGTVGSQNASTCMLSCKDGFYSSGVKKPFTCLADDELTTASYQGGTITCTGEYVDMIDGHVGHSHCE